MSTLSLTHTPISRSAPVMANIEQKPAGFPWQFGEYKFLLACLPCFSLVLQIAFQKLSITSYQHPKYVVFAP